MPASLEGFFTRGWSFTPLDTSVAALSFSSTDFFVTYDAQRSGEQVELGITLNAVWEYTDFTKSTALAQRKVIEDEMQKLKHSYVGKRGTLVTDTAGNARTLTNIMCSDIQFSITDSNKCLEYTIQFTYPLASNGGQMIARSFDFGMVTTNCGNFIVQYDDAGDRTVFKEVFRSAPIRVVAGPALQIIRILAIYILPTASYGDTPLQFRQAAEADFAGWVSLKGTEADLKIDGVDHGTCHLRNVTNAILDLPQAVGYDLEFNTGYAE